MPPSRDSPPQRPSSSLLQPPAQETPGGPGSTSRTTTTTSTTTTSTPTTTTTTHTRPRGTTSPAPTTTTTTTTYAPITSPSPSSHLRPRFSSVSSASSSRPSIRIRRFPSYQSTSQTNLPTLSTPSATSDEVPAASAEQDFVGSGRSSGGRRRSFSDPQRSYVPPQDGSRARGLSTRPSHGHMPEITEGASTSNLPLPPPAERLPPQAQQNPTLKRKSRSRLFRTRSREEDSVTDQEHSEYDSGLVDYLDLVDPEVSTLNTLTNVQNSLFIPDLGWLVNRRPTYTLTRRPSESTVPQQAPPPADGTIPEHPDAEAEAEGRGPLERTDTLTSITSRPSSTHYAVLPHGVALDGWSAEDRQELNDHVRHMLHSKRSRFKRSMKGFGQYVRRPLGFFVTLYATLITLFGLAWVLFLIGWVNVGGKQEYLIDIIDNIMVALFAIMGDGLAPFRAVDTYHMCFIAHYHHLTWRLRREKALPKLQNKNDLPPLPPSDTDLEGGAKTEEDEFSVLTEKQQKRLVHHQNKFAKSHTFYKPHETATHHAFPLRLLVAVVCLLDCHSLLQIALGTCTWSIDYHVRPFALTTVILCCSITVNISAGVVIMIGDRRTRKKDVLEKMHKQELTAEAMAKLAKKREKEREKSRTLLEPVPPPLSAETTKPLPDDPEGMREEREKHMSPPTSPTSPTTPTSPVARKPLPIAKRGDGVPSSPTSPSGMSKIRNIDTIPTSTLNLAKEKEF